MDPRTGLGRFRNFTISNYQLMEKCIEWCRTMTIDEIMAIPDIKERVELYNEQTEKFTEMVNAHTVIHGNTIVSDLRGLETIYTGNRFMVFAMFPQVKMSVHVMWGFRKRNTAITIGKSNLNRTSDVNVGSICLEYGGGGHRNAGTCQVDNEDVETVLPVILDKLNNK